MVGRRKVPSSHFPNQPEQHPPQLSTCSTLNWFSPFYSFFAVAVHSFKIALSVHIFQNSEHSFSANFEKNPAEVFSPGITSHVSASNLATHLTTSEQAAGSAGAGDGHEQTHESVGRPQDHGGDEEGGWQRGSPSRQLQRQNTGFREKLFLLATKQPSHWLFQVLQNMVHCADLSNPTKPLECYKVGIIEEISQQQLIYSQSKLI